MDKNSLEKYENCRLCARRCGVNRLAGKLGYCSVPAEMLIARAALHYWEEPPISGERGSGAIFFSGCSLRCIFCQNREISGGKSGVSASPERLAQIMLKLEADGAHNINLVTPTHYAPSIVYSVALARAAGLTVPIVYNTGSYETVETVKMLENTVDIYLADYKYNTEKSAEKLSCAQDYPSVARAAIAEMVRQRGEPVIEGNVMRSGVIVRILLLPNHVAEAKLAVKYLSEAYGDKIYLSLMNQYTPMAGAESPLNRPVTSLEYDELIDYAIKKGVRLAFIQEGKTASESFIPSFNGEGVV